MYIPDHYKEKDPEKIAAFLEAYPFGTLVTDGPSAPVATHLPFLIDKGNDNKFLEIAGHMARANPHWKLAMQQDSLLIFQEPHAYISTGLYKNRQTVPTWNYIAVHVTGRLQIINDREELLTLMTRSIRKFGNEEDQQDWERLDQEVANRLVKGVVAFGFQIRDIQAQFKLSQNKSPHDRGSVRHYLLNSDGPMHRELGAWM